MHLYSSLLSKRVFAIVFWALDYHVHVLLKYKIVELIFQYHLGVSLYLEPLIVIKFWVQWIACQYPRPLVLNKSTVSEVATVKNDEALIGIEHFKWGPPWIRSVLFVFELARKRFCEWIRFIWTLVDAHTTQSIMPWSKI